jgi:beta-glucosidase
LLPLNAEVGIDPVNLEGGLRVRFIGFDGSILLDEHRRSGRLLWIGDAILAKTAIVQVRSTFVAPESGRYALGFAGLGNFSFRIDGNLRAEGQFFPEGTDPFMAFLNPPTQSFPVDVEAGDRLELELEHRPEDVHGIASVTFTVGYEEPFGSAQHERARAVEVAASADLAVVVVGTTDRIESEGFDRDTLKLPDGQDELVRAVIAANPRTVVVVNAGAPVIMPWLTDAAAVLLTWFPGQEFGSALADVIAGVREPGGRLPHTWPAREEDVPVWQVEPTDGRLYYSEGIHVGYREWLRRQAKGGPRPALAFGYGQGYTTWETGVLTLEPAGGSFRAVATIDITNTGSRPGKQVLQLYVSRVSPSVIDRPVLWLVGHATLRADPGETVEARMEIRERALQYWSTEERGWVTEPGEFSVVAGFAADAPRASASLMVEP